ncbi:hypothetical protein BOTCAL_0451g00090 [Botryotinia calthae]|uniref:Uncharacterized protein n=1 Tax=Botryotinia calthae TaxID=38488 RepID=A0A4Y8CPT4_9HELO|nr:hypothetical protein BOTCAL_0451g00090 [Botryotinia calthae]
MSSPSVQSKVFTNISTKKYCSSTLARVLKKLLGEICLYIWKALTDLLSKVGNRIISHFLKIADAEAAIRAIKAQLVAQHVSFEQERMTHKDIEAKLQQQLDEYKSK